MSFEISSISATQLTRPAAPAAPVAPAATVTGMVSAVVESVEPVTVDTIPATPPPEVLDAIHTASESYSHLQAAGRQIHFATDPETGRLSIQVLGPSGNSLGTLLPGKVLELAAGGRLD
jgi:hypothetical protein